MQNVRIQSFKTTIATHEITVYELRCPSGFTVQLMNWGASVLDIQMANRAGTRESIVLGFENMNDYLDNAPYFGATIGRTAGRIKNGRYSLNGSMQQLPVDEGNHLLHGGQGAISHQLWQHHAQILEDGRAQVSFHTISKAGENGYKGNLSIELTYTLDAMQQLALSYRATTDAATLCNLTHHSYFNLSGNIRSTIHEHLLNIHADKICAMNEELLVNGEEWSVENTDFDYRETRVLTDILNSNDERIRQAKGVDHYFVFHETAQNQAKVTLTDPHSGRRMRVYTDQACAVLYAHNYAAAERLRGENIGQQYDALCIETQKCPHQPQDNGDHPARLLPDEVYQHQCVYAFDCLT